MILERTLVLAEGFILAEPWRVVSFDFNIVLA